MADRGAASRAEVRQALLPGARLAEATALMAVVCDLGTGQPLTTNLRICLAALRIADHIDDDSVDRRAVYNYSLVRLLGCTVETSRFAAAMGDEIELSRAMTPVAGGTPREMMPVLLRTVGAGAPPWRRARLIAGAMSFGAGMRSLMAGHCEVSRMLTHDLGLGAEVSRALDFTYERWDGKGSPSGARGEDIPLVTRVMHAAFVAVVQHAIGGRDRVLETARSRAGGQLDPAVAEVLAAHVDDVLAATEVQSPWNAVLDAEPAPPRPLSPDQADATAAAVACFADLKADHLAGHSMGVMTVAVAAGRAQGLDAGDLDDLRRAALIHDLGRVGVTTVIWDRRGPLSDDDWEEVRLHPYHTERVAGRVPWLAGAARIAALHHERLDGSGYHRKAGAQELSTSARLLAVADSYRALTEARPHRPAFDTAAAASVLRDEAAAGRLDGRAVRCVLEAAGHTVARVRRDLPAGLTEREVDVLRFIAVGSTIKEAARRLNVSPKTVDTHVQHIYGKVGCTTRAGASVFAMKHGLLEPSD